MTYPIFLIVASEETWELGIAHSLTWQIPEAFLVRIERQTRRKLLVSLRKRVPNLSQTRRVSSQTRRQLVLDK